jgi:hypothetical protein
MTPKMTVSELIEQLKNFNPNSQVLIEFYPLAYPLREVRSGPFMQVSLTRTSIKSPNGANSIQQETKSETPCVSLLAYKGPCGNCQNPWVT